MLKRPPLPLQVLLAVFLAAAIAGCNDTSDGERVPSGPGRWAGNFQPIIHTIDGRHLRFDAGSFQPVSIEHCREDGQRHATPIFDLSEIKPAGHMRSLCPELSGRFQMLHLIFPDRPALKVTLLCEDGCVTPGGYYPPLGIDVRVPWSQMYYIELWRP